MTSKPIPPHQRALRTRRGLLADAARLGIVVGGAAVLGPIAGCASPEEPAPLPLPPGRLRKSPWTQVWAPGTVRLNAEADSAAVLTVRLEGPAGVREIRSIPTVDELEYHWPPASGIVVDYPDEAGLHALHRLDLDDLTPGERYTWTLPTADGEISGSFRSPPAAGQGFRFAFLADTMMPNRTAVLAVLAAAEPDLVLHGGDLQYQTNPLDTWNGLFAELAPLTSRAPLHVCAGNHEYEDQNEFAVMFSRLFGEQATGGNAHRHTFDYGGVRFVSWNSEYEISGDNDPELQWLDETLATAAAAAAVQRTVLMFHRPYYTFGRSRANLTVRARLHPLLVRHGVDLVLTGHNHSYERFVVDGITYVVDGGGGAFLYDVDDTLADAAAERPDEPALRQAAEASYGALIVDVAADGTLHARRLRAEDGGETDAFTV